jgi:hypothetical protein
VALLTVVVHPEPLDQRAERQPLAHERHEDHGERQEDDQVASGKRRAGVGFQRDRERGG